MCGFLHWATEVTDQGIRKTDDPKLTLFVINAEQLLAERGSAPTSCTIRFIPYADQPHFYHEVPPCTLPSSNTGDAVYKAGQPVLPGNCHHPVHTIHIAVGTV